MKPTNQLLLLLAFVLPACVTTQPVSLPAVSPPPQATNSSAESPIASTDEITVQEVPTTSPTMIEPTEEIVPTITSGQPTLPTATAASQPAQEPTPTARSKPNLGPGAWKRLPVVPYVSDNVVQIYQKGLELGNNPHAYSKIGDCGSTPAWFMGDFDKGNDYYNLGDYQDLNEVIAAFQGSHLRTSLAARAGFNAPSLFVPLWSDPDFCEPDEPPLVCEYNIHRPVIAFIMLGANDIWHQDEFEPSMRRMIEYLLENGVVPILSTKADNLEGDGSINDTIARLAVEYEIPLINYWRAVQDIPGAGLQEDGVHLTWGSNSFNEEDNLTLAWPLRNLTALQALDAVWRKATGRSD